MHIARETAGAARTRSSPRPLLFKGGKRNAKLRAPRAARRRSRIPSSRRTPGPILRGGYCLGKMVESVLKQLTTVVMDPRFRADDGVMERCQLLRRVSRDMRPIAARRMLLGQPRPSGAEQFLAQRALGVDFLVDPAPRQFRHQHLGDSLEVAGRD